MNFQVLALAAALLAQAAPTTPPIPPTAYAGTWNLTLTALGTGTCSNNPVAGSTSAFIWLVSTQPDGGMSVAPQGQTAFPVLAGVAKDDVFRVVGRSQYDTVIPLIHKASAMFYDLKLQGGVLTGTAQYMGIETETVNDGAGLWPCFSNYTVSAKR